MTRRTWVAVAVCAALGGWIWKGEELIPSGNRPEYLWTMSPDDIVKVEVVRPEEQRWTLERTGTEWRMTFPRPYDLDPLVTENLLANAARLEVLRKISDQPGELEGYGLAQPPWELLVTVKDGSKKSVQLGRKTPDGRAFYVKQGQAPAVYTARVWGSEALEKTVAEMRKKNVWTLPAGEAVHRVVITGAHAARFERDEQAGWTVNGQPAEAQAVEKLVWALVDLKASKFPDDEPKDLEKYGLRSPSRVIQLFGKDKKSLLAKVLVGKESGFGIYIKMDGKPPVYEVEHYALKEALKPAKEYLPKKTETKS